MTDHEQQRRRNEYLQECAQVRGVWDQRIAHRRGILPGATLDPVVSNIGWCGQVQLVPGANHYGEVEKAADDIAYAYELPPGSVVVDPGNRGTADTSFLWAYRSPSHARHHNLRPWGLHGNDYAGESTPPGLVTRLEWAELEDWASKYAFVWKQIRRPDGRVDMEQFLRRLTRLEAAILDVLPRTRAETVRQIVEKAGLPYESLSEDVAEAIGLQQTRRRAGGQV
ncbi:hypothetical protein AQI88_38840 [Streptomyces cellostaticus]|uniref:Uncharacterized protein n=1 Tax=Streptomyces cellostaticus TaxID=67285 RepID=A0A117PT22_9ACTN|nr:hypothetical protein [Streptomyces cellostaticus]KUM90262.1 hypothetical protein AQI88_38840 [Streptomyces cellostaticus]